MSEQTPKRPPKPSKADKAHAAAKALVETIPGVGGSASVLLEAVIRPPLERRREKWFEEVAERLADLEQQDKNFKLALLAGDEVFQTVFLAASQAALRTHQAEKREALRNAVLNSAARNAPDEDVQLMFINFVDAFTASHLRILDLFADPPGWAARNNTAFREHYMGGRSTILEEAFSELAGRRSIYDQWVRDLHTRGLLGVDSLHTTVSGPGMMQGVVTDLGKQFLAYISRPGVPELS